MLVGRDSETVFEPVNGRTRSSGGFAAKSRRLILRHRHVGGMLHDPGRYLSCIKGKRGRREKEYDEYGAKMLERKVLSYSSKFS